MGKFSVLFASLAVFFFSPVLASAKEVAITGGAATFEAKAFPAVDIKGVGGKVTGIASIEDGKIAGTFKTSVKDFDTDNETRNEHMNKRMESDKYPEITLAITGHDIAAKTFAGALTFHGQTRPIVGSIDTTASKVKAEFKVNIVDFGLDKPNFAGVGMDEVITASVSFDYR